MVSPFSSRKWARIGPTLPPTAEACGYNHLGFLVDNLDETLAKLLAMPGVRLDIEPFVIPARKRRCAFIAGPCELYVELMEDVKD